jgi:hypothetical protein
MSLLGLLARTLPPIKEFVLKLPHAVLYFSYFQLQYIPLERFVAIRVLDTMAAYTLASAERHFATYARPCLRELRRRNVSTVFLFPIFKDMS